MSRDVSILVGTVIFVMLLGMVVRWIGKRVLSDMEKRSETSE